MGNGQGVTAVDQQAEKIENASEEEAARQLEETKKSINLDWHHSTRSFEDHFTIVSKKPIGRGHFADVFLGQAVNSGREGLNLEIGQLVAVKHVYRSRCSEEVLHKEVDALLELATREHPNVAALFDAFLTDDTLILVLEYCAGGELFEHLAGEGPYSEKAASDMVKQMAHVLHFLHKHNCTHRDLKPENILLANNGPNPLIKVADFGLATMKQKPFMSSVCGTWAYCAPEVKKDRVYTKAVDVWSLGVITYILVVGFHPFDPMGDSTEKELETRIFNGTFDFEDEMWDSVSSACKDLIVRMLTVDPAIRISVDEILKHAWITHEASESIMITAPNKLKPLMNKFAVKRKELGSVMHLMALSRMEHLALHHGLLTEQHKKEVHDIHDIHVARESKRNLMQGVDLGETSDDEKGSTEKAAAATTVNKEKDVVEESDVKEEATK